jgi:hypothetical protein
MLSVFLTAEARPYVHGSNKLPKIFVTETCRRDRGRIP